MKLRHKFSYTESLKLVLGPAMAQYSFEGDLAGLNERQLVFINKVILEQDNKVKKVIVKAVGKAGDNFIGNVKRINTEGENGVPASTEMARIATNAEIMFSNEQVLYTEVLPKMVQLQKVAGIPEADVLRYAKCYGSLSEPPNEVIKEDLNFTMLDNFDYLTNECVNSILRNFAFHRCFFL